MVNLKQSFKRLIVLSCVAFASAVILPPPISAIAAPQAASTTGATGTVVDETGEPFIGATVFVVGNESKGTSTDLDGNFNLSGVAKGAKLKISAVGYKPMEVEWKGTPLQIQLETNSAQLQEIVVTAMGIQRK